VWLRDSQRRSGRYFVALLRDLGFPASLRAHDIGPHFGAICSPRTRAQIGFVGWALDYISRARRPRALEPGAQGPGAVTAGQRNATPPSSVMCTSGQAASRATGIALAITGSDRRISCSTLPSREPASSSRTKSKSTSTS
jgi:hypothetical protein